LDFILTGKCKAVCLIEAGIFKNRKASLFGEAFTSDEKD
jgi:hypothetical protein